MMALYSVEDLRTILDEHDPEDPDYTPYSCSCGYSRWNELGQSWTDHLIMAIEAAPLANRYYYRPPRPYEPWPR